MNEDIDPDRKLLSSQAYDAREAFIKLGEALLEEGRKIIRWFQEQPKP